MSVPEAGRGGAPDGSVPQAPYPWQRLQWRSLIGRRRAGNLAHALLFCGPEGVGKNAFARALAEALLCERPGAHGESCGQCRACRLLRAGSHPDVTYCVPEADSKVIKIDQVRALRDALMLTSQYGGYRVAVLSPADRLNAAAANSLLKTLEEPPQAALLTLVTSQPSALPATVRSRCQRVVFPRPDAALARAWLAERGAPPSAIDAALACTDGAPLAALQLSRGDALARRGRMLDALGRATRGETDVLALADAWSREDTATTLDWMIAWVMDMIRLKLAPQPPYLGNPDLAKDLRALGQEVDLERLYGHLDRLAQARRLARGSISVNPALLLESVLIPWSDGNDIGLG